MPLDFKEGLQLLREHLLPNESNQSEIQLERKLIYLLKVESDYLKQVVWLVISLVVLTVVWFIDYNIFGILSKVFRKQFTKNQLPLWF